MAKKRPPNIDELLFPEEADIKAEVRKKAKGKGKALARALSPAMTEREKYERLVREEATSKLRSRKRGIPMGGNIPGPLAVRGEAGALVADEIPTVYIHGDEAAGEFVGRTARRGGRANPIPTRGPFSAPGKTMGALAGGVGAGGAGPRGGIPGFGGGKPPPSTLSKALKWGGRALGGLGLAMTALQLIDGYQEEFGGRRAAREGFEGLSKGLEAAQLQAALQAEEQTSRRVGWAEDSMREVQMGAANRQMRDEAELMGMMRDRAGELDQIAERYQPNLAEKLARLGVL